MGVVGTCFWLERSGMWEDGARRRARTFVFEPIGLERLVGLAEEVVTISG